MNFLHVKNQSSTWSYYYMLPPHHRLGERGRKNWKNNNLKVEISTLVGFKIQIIFEFENISFRSTLYVSLPITYIGGYLLTDLMSILFQLLVACCSIMFRDSSVGNGHNNSPPTHSQLHIRNHHRDLTCHHGNQIRVTS